MKNFDAIVVGGGHAGAEASLALARTGINTLLVTLTKESITFLACNPSIGGTAKGHLVCEIDALGGEMGKNADATTLQLRMLNLGKGPAVHSLRAQVDKNEYHRNMQKVLEHTPNLTILEDEGAEILTNNGEVCGLTTAHGKTFNCKAIVLCCGVYLNSRTITGEIIRDQGPAGFSNSKNLTKSLIDLGFEIRRFKTGTPPRLDGASIDYSKFEVQKGDTNIQTFSFLTKRAKPNTRVCYLGYTTAKTKQIILDNLDKAPMYSGVITGLGPRYCPSIETKIVRFSDKERHQIFLEPETNDNNQIYVQGMSTSMPMDIQHQMIESVAGLENAKFEKYGYAIEYDCINPLELYPTLESKKVKGLYFAGQINGTSGYEEAGAQGLVAGLNASLAIRGKEQIVLSRDNSYIGVLIDDLTTKGTNEPYRMMTSRAEYRLLLRQDNADRRLTQIGYNTGLVSEERYQIFCKKMQKIAKLKEKLSKTIAPSKELDEYLESIGEPPAPRGLTIDNLCKRANSDLWQANKKLKLFSGYSKAEVTEAGIDAKYEGYLRLQQQMIDRTKKLEEKKIPKDFDFSSIRGLRIEAIEKLNKIKPLSVGAASRISGVNPADITILLMHL
ncbi:MAG: tRNA uridine-5-carboxymethylaminomethyl(34) synthesis enzyme MnmG [Clostridia bacterium]|nr:tRNA uridine-5-carboxymethylaminomethyl(34) synthesis enzyme MnmG [Clostridia bacterium]